MDRNLFILLPIALIAGYFGLKLKVPAGGIIFSLVAVAGLKLLARMETGPVPGFLNLIPQAVLGLFLGTQFSNRVLEEISRMWGYILISVLVLFVTGIILAVVYAKMNLMNPPTAYLSTSPGALTGMVFMSLDLKDVNAPLVAIFHLIRMSCLVLTGPIVLKLIESMK
jgi:membrane AbrB-like protein